MALRLKRLHSQTLKEGEILWLAVYVALRGEISCLPKSPVIINCSPERSESVLPQLMLHWLLAHKCRHLLRCNVGLGAIQDFQVQSFISGQYSKLATAACSRLLFLKIILLQQENLNRYFITVFFLATPWSPCTAHDGNQWIIFRTWELTFNYQTNYEAFENFQSWPSSRRYFSLS